MKRSQSVLYLVILLLLVLLVYAWFFRRTPIPVNNELAKEHVIPMTEAAAYTRAFADAKNRLTAQLKDTSYLTREFNLPVCELFNKDAIATLLNKEGATGIRIYLGLNEKREVCFVIVPTSQEGKDIRGKLVADNGFSIPGISKAVALPPDQLEEALERGIRCPHMCDFDSPLSLP